MTRTVSLILRNLMFTVVVPGLGGVWLPWEIMTRGGHTVTPTAWPAVPVIAVGVALYAWCVWNFAAVGGGTPGPWDAPSRVVAAGPYRWVRNPIYLAALLIVLGQAWLFLAPQLLAYAAVMAVFFHLFITGYEERTLDRRFGRAYQDYQAASAGSPVTPADRLPQHTWHSERGKRGDSNRVSAQTWLPRVGMASRPLPCHSPVLPAVRLLASF